MLTWEDDLEIHALRKRGWSISLLADYEMNVNHKLVNSIMSEHGLYGLPRPGRRKPNLIGVDTPVDLVNRRFPATMPN
jgi:putative transposase